MLFQPFITSLSSFRQGRLFLCCFNRCLVFLLRNTFQLPLLTCLVCHHACEHLDSLVELSLECRDFIALLLRRLFAPCEL